MDGVQQRAGPAHVAGEPIEGIARRCACETRSRRCRDRAHQRGHPMGSSSGKATRSEERRRRRACSWSRTKRLSSSESLPRCGWDAARSTPAPRLEARRWLSSNPRRRTALIVAADRRPRRLRLLRDTLRRIGARAVPQVQVDLARGLPFGASFDLVVVDAPCSGLGTLRREPDLKWRRSPDDLAVFSEIQVAMLGHAATVVAPGGRLVYATCSSEPDENDAVAARFLATHSAFGFERSARRLPPRARGGARARRRAENLAGRAWPGSVLRHRVRAGRLSRRPATQGARPSAPPVVESMI